jgi:UDP-N-acetylglucosamine 1-carboxyvinyltransferase
MREDLPTRQLCWACPDAEYQDLRFGQLIKLLRLESGLSQRQLAERVGSTQSAIARMEAGGSQPKLATLKKLAEALDRDLHLYVRAKESA